MNKEKLTERIAEKLGVSLSEKELAHKIFIDALLSALNIGEALTIRDIGVFNLELKVEKKGNDRKNIRTLLYMAPKKDSSAKENSLFFTIDIPRRKKNSTEYDDEIFSIGIKKPVLPINEEVFSEDKSISVNFQKSVYKKACDLIAISEKEKIKKPFFAKNISLETIPQKSLEAPEEENKNFLSDKEPDSEIINSEDNIEIEEATLTLPEKIDDLEETDDDFFEEFNIDDSDNKNKEVENGNLDEKELDTEGLDKEKVNEEKVKKEDLNEEDLAKGIERDLEKLILEDDEEDLDSDDEEIDPLDADLAAIEALSEGEEKSVENLSDTSNVKKTDVAPIKESFPVNDDKLLIDEDGHLRDEFELEGDSEGDDEWDWGDELKEEISSDDEILEDTKEIVEKPDQATKNDNASQKNISKESNQLDNKNLKQKNKEEKVKKNKFAGLGKFFWVLVILFLIIMMGGLYWFLILDDSPNTSDENIIANIKNSESIIDTIENETKHVKPTDSITNIDTNKKELIGTNDKPKHEKDIKEDNSKNSIKNKVAKKKNIPKGKSFINKNVEYRKAGLDKKVGKFVFYNGKTYSVQVASFKSKRTAEQIAKKYIKNKKEAFIVKADLKKLGVWYRIRVDGFASKKEAEKFQKTNK